jgi:acyl-CoA thioester hydrolase
MGHISNISYFIYYEQARVDFLCDLKIAKMDETWGFVLASIKSDFLKQTYPLQKINIETQVLKIGHKSFSLGHKLLSEAGDILASGEEVIVHFDRASQSTQKLNDSMIEKLRLYEKN